MILWSCFEKFFVAEAKLVSLWQNPQLLAISASLCIFFVSRGSQNFPALSREALKPSHPISAWNLQVPPLLNTAVPQLFYRRIFRPGAGAPASCYLCFTCPSLKTKQNKILAWVISASDCLGVLWNLCMSIKQLVLVTCLSHSLGTSMSPLLKWRSPDAIDQLGVSRRNPCSAMSLWVINRIDALSPR